MRFKNGSWTHFFVWSDFFLLFFVWVDDSFYFSPFEKTSIIYTYLISIFECIFAVKIKKQNYTFFVFMSQGA